jgi:hypothetical protein
VTDELSFSWLFFIVLSETCFPSRVVANNLAPHGGSAPFVSALPHLNELTLRFFNSLRLIYPLKTPLLLAANSEVVTIRLRCT